MRAAPPLALLMLLAGCGKASIHTDGAWVRLAAVPGSPAAAYFTVHGGDHPATLTRVDADGAARAEMHESMAGSGAMLPLVSVAVPAGGEVRFAPGGRHVMLFDVVPGVKPGGTTTLTLHFPGLVADRVAAKVVAAGDAAPE